MTTTMLGWLKRRVTTTADTVKTVARDPKSAGSIIRRAFVRVWKARGGGLYGLGYVIAFVALQVQSFAGEVDAATSVETFVATQVTGYLLRVAVDSVVNAFLALLWPAFVVEAFGGTGIVLLLVAFYVFERALRPLVERTFPELSRRPHAPSIDDQGAH